MQADNLHSLPVVHFHSNARLNIILSLISFYSKFIKLTIIRVYAPINDVDDETKQEFYKLLQEMVEKVHQHNVIMTTGDIYAKVRKNNNGLGKEMG